VSLKKSNPPTLWIVAGPNGSGKSTLYSNANIEGFGRSIWIINPDLLAERIRTNEKMPLLQANGEALTRIQHWLNASINAYQTIGVETVLSTDKYQTLVTQAKDRGFEIRLLYVTLRTPQMNVERVRLRVAAGGHRVLKKKIIERRKRSFQHLPWFLERADVALIYDNSDDKPILVARKENGLIQIEPDAPKEILYAVESIKTN